MTVGDRPLVGRRVLVVVDNHFVAEDIRQAILEGGGSIVGPTATAAGALRLITRDAPNTAVLGVVLEHATSGPVAKRLAELRIPSLLITGLAKEAVPPALRNVPYLGKPYLREELISTLLYAIAEADRSPEQTMS